MKAMTPSAITDEHLNVIASIFSNVTGRKFVLPCKCDGHLWKQWMAMVNRRIEAQTKAGEHAITGKKTITPAKDPNKKSFAEHAAEFAVNNDLFISEYGTLTNYKLNRKLYTTEEFVNTVRKECIFTITIPDKTGFALDVPGHLSIKSSTINTEPQTDDKQPDNADNKRTEKPGTTTPDKEDEVKN